MNDAPSEHQPSSLCGEQSPAGQPLHEPNKFVVLLAAIFVEPIRLLGKVLWAILGRLGAAIAAIVRSVMEFILSWVTAAG